MRLLPQETLAPLGLEHLSQGDSVPRESPLTPELSPGEGGGQREQLLSGLENGAGCCPPCLLCFRPLPLSTVELCPCVLPML